MNLIEKNSFPAFSRAKVLYIEDELLINSSMTKQLNFFKSNEIFSVENCNRGLQLYENNDFDLIICDICTPIMDGIELIKTIRQKDAYTKIVVVTGFDIKEVKKDLEGFHVDAYFEKPIRLYKLLKEIESTLLK